MTLQDRVRAEQVLRAELEGCSRDLEAVERELHFLRLDALTKDGMITDLRCRISELEELHAAGPIPQTRDEVIDALTRDLTNAVNERMLLEAYAADLRGQLGAPHDPGTQSARIAIVQAWNLTTRAIRRRLFGR